MNKPIYHITPEKGWMNDPNGLVEYNGVYHVFYQADPEHLINENIGWGHKISSDLLHWEECQPALLPDQSYDRDGCFTGSAVIKDDKMYLLYTGHVNQESGYIETQNLAVSKDGIHFEKYFIVEDDGMYQKIDIDEILYFSIIRRGCEIHILQNGTGKILRTRKRIQEIEEELRREYFCRIHKSFLVNPRYITEVKKSEIKMDNNEILSVSKARRKTFEDMFAEYLSYRK